MPMKHVLTAKEYSFSFEKACRFREGLQDALSIYKEVYDRKKLSPSSQAMSYFKPSTLSTALTKRLLYRKGFVLGV